VASSAGSPDSAREYDTRVEHGFGTAIVVERVLGRIFYRKWPHIASAYISGISVGILARWQASVSNGAKRYRAGRCPGGA
jgi:hypothetical protein